MSVTADHIGGAQRVKWAGVNCQSRQGVFSKTTLQRALEKEETPSSLLFSHKKPLTGHWGTTTQLPKPESWCLLNLRRWQEKSHNLELKLKKIKTTQTFFFFLGSKLIALKQSKWLMGRQRRVLTQRRKFTQWNLTRTTWSDVVLWELTVNKTSCWLHSKLAPWLFSTAC